MSCGLTELYEVRGWRAAIQGQADAGNIKHAPTEPLLREWVLGLLDRRGLPKVADYHDVGVCQSCRDPQSRDRRQGGLVEDHGVETPLLNLAPQVQARQGRSDHGGVSDSGPSDCFELFVDARECLVDRAYLTPTIRDLRLEGRCVDLCGQSPGFTLRPGDLLEALPRILS